MLCGFACICLTERKEVSSLRCHRAALQEAGGEGAEGAMVPVGLLRRGLEVLQLLPQSFRRTLAGNRVKTRD